MAATHVTARPTTAAAPRPSGRGRRTATLVLLSALGVAAIGYGTAGALLGTGPPEPRTVESVGPVAGSTALVAVLARDDRVVVYVYDDDLALGERFSGTLTGDRAVLHSGRGAELFVDVHDGGATGTFTPPGATTPHPFRTIPTPGSSDARDA